MGDDKDPSASASSNDAVSSAPPPASVAPRPVSVVPRPAGSGSPVSRMPPPPSARGFGPGAAPGALRSSPPPPPQRTVLTASPPPAAPSSPPPVAAVAASPSVVPRAPATPPPPQPHGVPPSFARPPAQPAPSVTAQLEQRLGATQVELRKLGSERHTLRARLRREADRVRELESALGAEKDLRRQASEEHQAALAGLRLRLAELEVEKDQALERLARELAEARAAALPAARPGKPLRGLRRIRGIGPAYQRSLEQLEVTRVQQIAAWTETDVHVFAEKLRVRAERIFQEDWVGQAQALEPDPED